MAMLADLLHPLCRMAVYASFGFFLIIVTVGLYRVTLHPLARVPGPRLARLSNIWYARQITKGRAVQLGLELHKKYGDVVRVGPNEVWLNSKEAFDQIYCAGKGFEKSDFYLGTALSRPYVDWKLNAHFPDTLDLLSERDMKRYRLQRRLIGRVYSAANVSRYEEVIDSTLKLAVKRVSSFQGQEIDLCEWMHIITVECLGAAVLSWSPGMLRHATDWGTLTHSYRGWRRKSLFGVFPTAKKLERWSPDLGRHFSSLWGVTYKTPRDFKTFFPAVLGPNPRKDKRVDLLSDLIQLHRDKPDFTEDYLRKMAVTNFGAGHETMASTLTAAVAMIASHRHVQTRVEDELRTTNEALAYAGGSRLPYTRAAIREAMRLHPVVAMSLARNTPSPGLHLHGFYLPPNTTVGCSPVSLHRNEDIYGAKADCYIPSRWLGGEAATGPGDGPTVGTLRAMEKYSLNWGGGSRSCPGRNLAELMVFKVVATLFANFDVEVSIPGDADKEAYFLSMLSGVKVRFFCPLGQH
ncbi:uncharacterized protein UV8b_00584 [Ustilaginoidea virens]|uniref:Cytochrome P450 family protein n=1 Tax=Ustilaginoidea virens TaxID=1159556 RepID=A0A8E5HJ99_USTVR|nr:uncharacterized protein UV8b_00584 [Ustilaginoidea virens]QUC16343.1 hypothetical protein UV8b_00584 [Ustilaginoidea virens]